MTPRPDLSNASVEIETGNGEIRCMARRRSVWVDLAIGTIAMGVTLTPAWLVSDGRGIFRDGLTATLAVGLPLLALLIYARMIQVMRRPRGLQISQGTVTLLTPDFPLSQHVFDVRNLKSAQLVRSGSAHNLRIERRRGLSIEVFQGYRSGDLESTMDLVNSFVVADLSRAFEVIPMAKVVALRAQPTSPSSGTPGESRR